MCTYSMIMKDWLDGPNRIPLPGFPYQPEPWKYPYPDTNPAPKPIPMPSVPNIFQPKIDVTPDIAKLMLEILKKVDDLDKKLNREDCLVDEQRKKEYQKILRKISKTKCPCKKKKAKKKTVKRSVDKKTLNPVANGKILADNGGPVLLKEANE